MAVAAAPGQSPQLAPQRITELCTISAAAQGQRHGDEQQISCLSERQPRAGRAPQGSTFLALEAGRARREGNDSW